MANHSNKKKAVHPTCIDRLNLWGKVTIEFIEGSATRKCETRVEDYDKKSVFISIPTGVVVPEYGSRVTVTFIQYDGLHIFDAVLESVVRDQRQYLSLTPISGVRHVQRRGAVRVDMLVELELAAIQRPVEEPFYVGDLRWERSITADFSSSGILARSTKSCRIGDLIALRFMEPLAPNTPRVVLTSWRRPHLLGDTHYMGLQFIVRERVRDFLLQDEIRHIPEELMMMNAMITSAYGKFVFDYELSQRKQEQAWS